MGQNTKIEWADHTFNPWWGCAKVSAGCANCYAETFAARFGVGWGAQAERRPASEKSWAEPIRWNKAAEREGKRARVFCSSMADVFDEQAPAGARERLWGLIQATPWLDWLLLTKRPENFHLAPWLEFPNLRPMEPPANVWLGVSVENQTAAEWRIPVLLRTPAAIRFVSAEPLLGRVDLKNLGTGYLKRDALSGMLGGPGGIALTKDHLPSIDWVIAGGESGHGARPMHPEWARALRDQCQAAGVPFFFKQHGEWEPSAPVYQDEDAEGNQDRITAPREIAMENTGSIAVHEEFIPGFDHQPRPENNPWIMARTGKKAAGRLLDGREWNEIPEARA